MRKETKYECEYCRALHDSDKEAYKCEDSHYKAVRIKKSIYVQRYKVPCTVVIEFEDGKCEEYRFNGRILY